MRVSATQRNCNHSASERPESVIHADALAVQLFALFFCLFKAYWSRISEIPNHNLTPHDHHHDP